MDCLRDLYRPDLDVVAVSRTQRLPGHSLNRQRRAESPQLHLTHVDQSRRGHRNQRLHAPHLGTGPTQTRRSGNRVASDRRAPSPDHSRELGISIEKGSGFIGPSPHGDELASPRVRLERLEDAEQIRPPPKVMQLTANSVRPSALRLPGYSHAPTLLRSYARFIATEHGSDGSTT